jgi:hypothetical protein
MNGFKIFLFITFSCIFATSAFSDIYEWTDADGVKHYSNYAPPKNYRILMKTKEEPYDEEADRARAEAERQAQLEQARLEIAQRQAELELREAEAERKLAEADRLAEKALRDDASDSEESENSQSYFRSYGYGCYDYYYGCGDPLYGQRYYRNETASIFFKKPPYATPYRNPRYKRVYENNYRKIYRYKYPFKTPYRPEAYHYKNYPNARSNDNAGIGRIGTNVGGVYGRGSFSGRSSAMGRRR